MTLTKATLKDSIEALEALGFKRWTKAGMDSAGRLHGLLRKVSRKIIT